MLVVPELEKEIEMLWETRDVRQVSTYHLQIHILTNLVFVTFLEIHITAVSLIVHTYEIYCKQFTLVFMDALLDKTSLSI